MSTDLTLQCLTNIAVTTLFSSFLFLVSGTVCQIIDDLLQDLNLRTTNTVTNQIYTIDQVSEWRPWKQPQTYPDFSCTGSNGVGNTAGVELTRCGPSTRSGHITTRPWCGALREADVSCQASYTMSRALCRSWGIWCKTNYSHIFIYSTLHPQTIQTFLDCLWYFSAIYAFSCLPLLWNECLFSPDIFSQYSQNILRDLEEMRVIT